MQIAHLNHLAPVFKSFRPTLFGDDWPYEPRYCQQLFHKILALVVSTENDTSLKVKEI